MSQMYSICVLVYQLKPNYLCDNYAHMTNNFFQIMPFPRVGRVLVAHEPILPNKPFGCLTHLQVWQPSGPLLSLYLVLSLAL